MRTFERCARPFALTGGQSQPNGRNNGGQNRLRQGTGTKAAAALYRNCFEATKIQEPERQRVRCLRDTRRRPERQLLGQRRQRQRLVVLRHVVKLKLLMNTGKTERIPLPAERGRSEGNDCQETEMAGITLQLKRHDRLATLAVGTLLLCAAQGALADGTGFFTPAQQRQAVRRGGLRQQRWLDTAHGQHDDRHFRAMRAAHRREH
jgi:hypothetical protein